ncbi:MAG: YggT family protein [Chloroflexota bacterium]|nr:YggT family protein [Chloroflexota bacterium]
MDSLILVVVRLLDFYLIILFLRVMLTWIPNLSPDNPIVRVLGTLTDPVLEMGRRVMPPKGGVDFSPMLVFFAIMIFREILTRLV